jgi:transposase InsO family protein
VCPERLGTPTSVRCLSLPRDTEGTQLSTPAPTGDHKSSPMVSAGSHFAVPQATPFCTEFPRWLHTYNHHRGHTALGGHPPSVYLTSQVSSPS